MKEGKITKIGMILLVFMLLTSCGNVQEQLETENETVLNMESSSSEKEIINIKEWGKVLYEYSSKEDSAIYSKGNSAVVTVNQWEQYVKYYLLAGETEESAKNLATKEAEEYEALYSNAIANGYNVSEEELNSYLEKLKQTFQEAANKETMTAVMEAFPSEQEYWDYQRTVYQKDIPIQKYIEAEREVYMKEQNTDMDWDTYFEKWKAELRQSQNFQKVN
ncbi:hypothetical protein NDGK_00371 [Clostridiales bacterium CHKCI001]|nr:hypothetical protein NDGK_00371 [Clostridiales bacterium CHKCI001]